MITADDCLKFAAECEELAQDPKLGGDREQILKIARIWRDMAADQLALTAPVH